jgi:N-methylhydantoinase B
MYRDYKFLEDEAVLQVRADRNVFRPYGLYGGAPGERSRNYLNPGTAGERILPGKVTMTIRQGDVFRHELPGGGGWGDPLDRDPAAVLSDVRNEYVGSDSAVADYGVIIDTVAWRVDETATAALRQQMRSARGGIALPDVRRDDHDPTAAPLAEALS